MNNTHHYYRAIFTVAKCNVILEKMSQKTVSNMYTYIHNYNIS